MEDITYKWIVKLMIYAIVPLLIIVTIFASILCFFTQNIFIQLIFILLFVTIIIKPFLKYLNWLMDNNYLK
ncbi:MAG: hypothetical protein IJI22_06350 [Bacilli bacterium]|nr:hypothetical protein [Bacilli bacterium]MBQ7277481.1 hypothetical protein [Bacilli bacterium]